MREILFRGKSKHTGVWVTGAYVNKNWYPGKGVVEETNIISYEDGDECLWHLIIPETVGQYTGLTDKNGKKIFEGDILRTGTRMGYVLFEKGCFRFRWKNFDKYRADFFKTCIITEYGSFRELEVIGNIHDNPELLKVGD